MNASISPLVARIVELALEEDLGRGDVTTDLCVPPDLAGRGQVISRMNGLVVSGLDVFGLVMERVDRDVVVTPRVINGQTLNEGATILDVEGSVASMLMGERVALNFLQRLSGVATATARLVDQVGPESSTRIVDTRKTTPGMRFLERKAVLHGGGQNHRVDLAGGVLIKENHIAAAGSVSRAVIRCLDGAPHPLRVEVEVRNLAELEEALSAGAHAVLLDNMDPAQLRECVEIVAGRAIVEASGGINLQTAREVASTGVDIISVGALTHSPPAADISFLIDGV